MAGEESERLPVGTTQEPRKFTYSQETPLSYLLVGAGWWRGVETGLQRQDGIKKNMQIRRVDAWSLAITGDTVEYKMLTVKIMLLEKSWDKKFSDAARKKSIWWPMIQISIDTLKLTVKKKDKRMSSKTQITGFWQRKNWNQKDRLEFENIWLSSKFKKKDISGSTLQIGGFYLFWNFFSVPFFFIYWTEISREHKITLSYL